MGEEVGLLDHDKRRLVMVVGPKGKQGNWGLDGHPTHLPWIILLLLGQKQGRRNHIQLTIWLVIAVLGFQLKGRKRPHRRPWSSLVRYNSP